ncbi:hypothetical protein [Candidatus Mycoplasma haematohominis]|uniref:hypothetical protein n=1 Tax=Candidatus Mycoplasma haematohominis TaxID=1494318 RepID=UPI001C0A708C|nr:hypothetical protein [Candidatus Mycoplasma haemohominis]
MSSNVLTFVLGGVFIAVLSGSSYFLGKKIKEELNHEVERTVRAPTFLLHSEEDSDIKNRKEYIGNDVGKVKKLLENAKGNLSRDAVHYLNTLKARWNGMNGEARPDIDKINSFNNLDDVSDYITKWCKRTSKKTLVSVQLDERTAEGKRWGIFKDVCFKKI